MYHLIANEHVIKVIYQNPPEQPVIIPILISRYTIKDTQNDNSSFC